MIPLHLYPQVQISWMMKKRIAIFGSGGGSNAEAIIAHFTGHKEAEIALIVTNNPGAFILNRADQHGISTFTHTAEDLINGRLSEKLKTETIDFIVLAGYLKKVPDEIIASFPDRIVNIHPALLPKFGGKGMYGMHVHRAVVEAGESVSGITIHNVNENYDEGNIIEQHECPVLASDKAEDLQMRVLKLEHTFYAPCIDKLLKQL